MSNEYEHFVAFLLGHEGSEQEVLDLQFFRRLENGRLTFTVSGLSRIIEQLAQLLNHRSTLDAEQITAISETLYFAQVFGGCDFVDKFLGSILIPQNLIMEVKLRLPSTERERSNAFERAFETEWRETLYTQCTDLISGYGNYSLYQPTTLAFESNRVLPEPLICFLDTLALCSPGEFLEVCKTRSNPVWPLRFIDRFHDKELNENFINKVTVLLSGLPDGQAGVLLAHLWDVLRENRLDVFKRILDEIELERVLIIMARIFSRLIHEAFPGMKGMSKPHVSAKLCLNELIKWLAGRIEREKDLTTDILRVKFIDILYGPVNQEEKWIGLLLAKHLNKAKSKQSQVLVSFIRRDVIQRYPEFWATVGDDGIYCSGPLTIALVDELAEAIVTDMSWDEAYNWLAKQERIFTAVKLWRLKDLHEYGRFLAEQKLSVIHVLLALRIILRFNEQQVENLEGVWPRIYRFTVDLIEELEISPGGVDWLLLDPLFFQTGLALAQFGIPDDENLVSMLAWINHPRSLTELLKGVRQEEIQSEILNRLDRITGTYSLVMNNIELLDTAGRLLAIEQVDRANRVVQQVNKEGLNHDQFKYWQLIRAQISIENAMRAEDKHDQIELLQSARGFLELKQKGREYLRDEDINLLLLQVIGWLVDRQAIDSTYLFNSYNLIALNEVVNGKKGIIDFSPNRQLVCALSLVRILENHKNSSREYEMDILIEGIFDSCHEDIVTLIKAWWAKYRQNKVIEREALAMVEMYTIKLRDNIMWLPRPLEQYLNDSFPPS